MILIDHMQCVIAQQTRAVSDDTRSIDGRQSVQCNRTYMKVMGGAKSLADQCLVKPEQGNKQLVMPRSSPTTRLT